MKVLVLGVSGMLGGTLFRYYKVAKDRETYGTVRTDIPSNLKGFASHVTPYIECENLDALTKLLNRIKPDTVINAIGLVKQRRASNDPLRVIPTNALFPHRLAQLCRLSGAQLVHVSTDCVFSGTRGRYGEHDVPDAVDLYGLSKLLGEVGDVEDVVTLRTSIVGNEYGTNNGLLEWFLRQNGDIPGYTRAVFSGLPTVELAEVIDKFVLGRKFRGVLHVSSDPISKYQLLKLFAMAYGKEVRIVPSETVVIDRSLVSKRFEDLTGYRSPPWEELVEKMRSFHKKVLVRS